MWGEGSRSRTRGSSPELCERGGGVEDRWERAAHMPRLTLPEQCLAVESENMSQRRVISRIEQGVGHIGMRAGRRQCGPGARWKPCIFLPRPCDRIADEEPADKLAERVGGARRGRGGRRPRGCSQGLVFGKGVVGVGHGSGRRSWYAASDGKLQDSTNAPARDVVYLSIDSSGA